jgi:hypothetical protein
METVLKAGMRGLLETKVQILGMQASGGGLELRAARWAAIVGGGHKQ